jgi:hypothetical protein
MTILYRNLYTSTSGRHSCSDSGLGVGGGRGREGIAK